MRIWCIHGNLQLSPAWDETVAGLSACLAKGGVGPVSFEREDLWRERYDSFEHWTSVFLARVRDRGDRNNWLMGYSLGGRLGLHALLESPSLWQGAVIVAADPGSATADRKKDQLAFDRAWATRFLHEPWGALTEEWDRLPVFGGRQPAKQRVEANYSREAIAGAFVTFSKGVQQDLLPALCVLDAPPLLYVTGEEDARYRALGEQLVTACRVVTHVTIPAACHRVPWENNLAFIRAACQFMLENN